MKGVITSRDVLMNSFTIIREFGPGLYIKCLRAMASGRSCTFLDLVTGH
jgi:hypothetical protein